MRATEGSESAGLRTGLGGYCLEGLYLFLCFLVLDFSLFFFNTDKLLESMRIF